MDENFCQRKLEESRKKLTEISKQIDYVDKKDVHWCCIDQVATSIEELQTLISWIAERKDNEDNTIVLQKLQQLSKIRQVLEKTVAESEQNQHYKNNFCSALVSNYVTPVNDSESSLPNAEKNSVSYPGVLQHEPFRTLNNYYMNSINTVKPTTDNICEKRFSPENINLYLKNLCSLEPPPSQLVGDLTKETDDQHDSLGTAVSEDEGLGEESKRGDLVGHSSLSEMTDSAIDLNTEDLSSTMSTSYKEKISPTVKRRDQTKFRETWCHRNSIELCLATITKLKESLQIKEKEILDLKKSTQQKNDATELQAAVKNLKRNMDDLQSSVSTLEHENSTLKETLLELEEAENDARLQGQRVEGKLTFLQEKDSHFQAEFAETKHALKLCLDELSLKDASEREMHSQLKFMEVLVHKYEKQLKNLEAGGSLSQKCCKEKNEKEKFDLKIPAEKIRYKGFQTNTELMTENYDDDRHLVSSDHGKKRSVFQDISCQTDIHECVAKNIRNDFGVQTDVHDDGGSSAEELQTLIRLGIGLAAGNYEGHNLSTKAEFKASFSEQKELLERIHHLVLEDADLQEQLNHVDQINLNLWQKLHNLQFHIGECNNENSHQNPASESDNTPTFLSGSALGKSIEINESEIKKLASSAILSSFDCSEGKIKERLSHLEEINSSFLKKLEMREKLYLEQERQHQEWLKMEERLTGELKSLGAERDSLRTHVTQLEVEKVQLSTKVKALEEELCISKEKHQKEATKIIAERDEIRANLQKTIDDLVVREKDYLKQIAKLKSTRNKQEEKLKFEDLKSSYVQLQIELNGYRDQMENMMSEFDDQLDSLKENHSVEENRLLDEIGLYRSKDSDCEMKLNTFFTRQLTLEKDARSKEKDLEVARNYFKSHMQKAEEEHRTVEMELKKKLSQMEEGTAFATKALTEEKVKLEKELQENINDLRSKEELYKTRILELESNVSQLHQELHQLTGNLHTKLDFNENMSFQQEHLLNEIQELRLREGELREKLDEMEKKESAYRETLEHADRIVASVERGYKNKIEELEMSERCLKQRVGYLEEVENRLRTTLQKERRSYDGRRPDELIVELAEAEKREHCLKEDVNALEASNRLVSNKVRELEKAQQNLEEQLNDHDELATSFEKLQMEQESIRKENTKLRKSESSLQLALHEAEGLLETRQIEISAELQRFNREKHDLEETISQLRSQVREMKERMEKRLVPFQTEGESLGKNIQYEHNSSFRDVNKLTAKTTAAQSPENVPRIDVQNPSPSSATSDISTVQEVSPINTCSKNVNSTRSEGVARPKPEGVVSDKQENNLHCTLGATGGSRAEKEYSEVRLQLEECMTRAMDAMKMEMKNKEVEISSVEEQSEKETFLPPYNFHVVQQVGSDTLLVGWEYTEIPNLEGYELYVDDQLHETVYAPDRRKAVISGLDLSRPLTLSICAVSTAGQVSKPQTLDLSQNTNQGFFFQDDDEDDDELFDDDVVDKNLRPYSMEW